MSVSDKSFVRFENVSKSYGNLLALEDVSFVIGKGENFGYIGPNGAGKTTTIKILVGLLTEFEGGVSIGSYSMPKDRDKVHEMMGYLPQRVSFQDWRTLEQTLSTFGRLSGMGEERVEERISGVLDTLRLSELRKRKIGKLSGGTIQKVGISQALLHDPKMLVLDEPLSGLDPASRHEMKEIIKDLSKGGTTVLFSSHILSDVQDVADRIGILDLGRIVQVGTLEELKSQFPSEREIEIELSKTSDRLEELESLDGVGKVERRDSKRLLVRLTKDVDIDEISHEIIRKLIDLDCRIRSLTPVYPDLDEVYLKYVGVGEGP